MLNPSTADEDEDDPTIRRCVGFSSAWGYEAMTVCNLFALRSTDPAALRRHADPIGPGNDSAIVSQALAADEIVCAWGIHGWIEARGACVRDLLSCPPYELTLHHLGLTKAGQPRHPLYLRADLMPERW